MWFRILIFHILQEITECLWESRRRRDTDFWDSPVKCEKLGMPPTTWRHSFPGRHLRALNCDLLLSAAPFVHSDWTSLWATFNYSSALLHVIVFVLWENVWRADGDTENYRTQTKLNLTTNEFNCQYSSVKFYNKNISEQFAH